MAKRGDKHVDAQGQEWRFTDGGNWRLYKNGKATDTISRGSTPPGGSAASGGATGGTQAIANTTPQNLSPEGSAYLNKAKSDLQGQVAAGLINQLQADQEYARREQQIGSYSPELQKSAWSLANQGIPGAAQDNELYRLQTLANTTQPNTNTNLTADSSTSQVQNEIMDASKAGQIAGNTLTNPNQYNPFGSQTTTFDPITGQPTVTQNLSQANQDVLGGLQGGSVQAGQVMQGLLGGIGGMTGSGEGQPNSNLSNAIYKQLTQYVDTNYERDRDQLEQRLVQTGNPVGSPKYNAQMAQLNQRYDTIKSNAGNQAVMGQMQATQGLIPSLSGVQGAGFYQPNFQGFNAVAYQQPDVQGLYNTQVGTALTQEQIQAQIQQAQIQAGATLGAANTAANASMHNTQANIDAQQNQAPGAFNSKPPGS